MDLDMNKLTGQLLKSLSPYYIVLFGSRAAGKATDHSDIDLAFLSDEDFDEYEIFMTAQKLAEITGCEVDLIDLKKASAVFKTQIITRGKALIDADNIKTAEFRMRSLKEYALLNEERQCVLEKIMERGSVYGD